MRFSAKDLVQFIAYLIPLLISLWSFERRVYDTETKLNSVIELRGADLTALKQADEKMTMKLDVIITEVGAMRSDIGAMKGELRRIK